MDEYIEIETRIDNKCFETSHYTSVQDFFYSHVKESEVDQEIQVNNEKVFKLNVGQRFNLHPSKWSIKFCEEKGLPIREEDYTLFEIVDIEVEYYDTHPNAVDNSTPLIKIKVIMEKV